MLFARFLLAFLMLQWSATAGFAQDKPTEPPAGEITSAPALRLPVPSDLGLATPRPVKAVSAMLGLGRQRLALVVGNGTLGNRPMLASAPRDTQAVAAALRAAGFVVMVREDLSAADLRASLAELRDRLQPGALGFVYVTALAVQVNGQNLWLPREAPLEAALPPAQLAQRLAQAGVPVSEIINALLGTPDSPRMLVLDAAYAHPALAGLPQAGLSEEKLPPGMVALFSSALGVAQARPEAADLPAAPAADAAPAAELAASRFARALVDAIATPRITGAEALRTTRRTLFDGSQGLVSPWLSGDNDSREELAESTLLDSLIPRTPEDFAREALKQASNRGRRAAGEQSVAEVLQQSTATPSAGEAAANASNATVPPPPPPTPTPTPSVSSLLNTLGLAASAVGAVASVAATAAGVAAAAPTQALLAAQATSAAVSVVGTAATVASTAGSAASSVMALASRLGSDGAATAPAAAATATAAAAAPAATALAASGLPTAAPAAPARGTAPSQPSRAGNVTGDMPVQSVLASAQPPAARPTATRLPAAPPVDGRTASNSAGGERPVYTPRTNSYGYAEGDTFTYQVTDTWKGEVTGSYTTAIEEVLGDGKLLANGAQLQMDAQGRITKQHGLDGTVSTFEPSQDLWWSNPKRGESRDVLFKETFQRADASRGTTEWKGSTSVGRPRTIDTPAGPYEALPIESSGWYYEALDGGAKTSGKWTRTVWYSPKLGHPVAIDIQDADRVGKLLRRERVELMHAQTSRGTP